MIGRSRVWTQGTLLKAAVRVRAKMFAWKPVARLLVWWQLRKKPLQEDESWREFRYIKGREVGTDIQNLSLDASDWYCYFELPNGLVVGREFKGNRDYGFERWNYILKKNIPSLAGKSVLDVGCNAGSITTCAALEGAARCVGIDNSEARITNARYLAAHCGHDLPNMEFYVLDVVRDKEGLRSLGQFDVIFLLNVLYYWGNEVDAVFEELRDMGHNFVFQGNHTPKKKLPDSLQALRTVEGLLDFCQRHNLTVERVVKPWRYRRPLVVAHK